MYTYYTHIYIHIYIRLQYMYVYTYVYIYIHCIIQYRVVFFHTYTRTYIYICTTTNFLVASQWFTSWRAIIQHERSWPIHPCTKVTIYIHYLNGSGNNTTFLPILSLVA